MWFVLFVLLLCFGFFGFALGYVFGYRRKP